MSAIEFESKMLKIHAILMSFALNLTRNSEDARDLYQETAYRAIKNRDKFMTGTNFKAWTMTIMKNIFINGYRKRSKAKTIFDSTDNNHFINSGKNTVRNEGNSNILMKELNAMIEALDDGLRIPFKLHFEGYKYQDIAERMTLPLGTVKSRIFFARKSLKAQIVSLYGEAIRS